MAEDRGGKKPKIQVELFFWHPGKCLAGEPGIFSSWVEIPFVVAGIVSGTRSGVCPLFFLFKSIIPLFQVLDWRRSCPAVGSSRIWGKRAWIAQRGEGGRAGWGWQGGGAGAGGRRGWELLKSVAAEGVVAGIPWGRLSQLLSPVFSDSHPADSQPSALQHPLLEHPEPGGSSQPCPVARC